MNIPNCILAQGKPYAGRWNKFRLVGHFMLTNQTKQGNFSANIRRIYKLPFIKGSQNNGIANNALIAIEQYKWSLIGYCVQFYYRVVWRQSHELWKTRRWWNSNTIPNQQIRWKNIPITCTAMEGAKVLYAFSLLLLLLSIEFNMWWWKLNNKQKLNSNKSKRQRERNKEIGWKEQFAHMPLSIAPPILRFSILSIVWLAHSKVPAILNWCK